MLDKTEQITVDITFQEGSSLDLQSIDFICSIMILVVERCAIARYDFAISKALPPPIPIFREGSRLCSIFPTCPQGLTP